MTGRQSVARASARSARRRRSLLLGALLVALSALAWAALWLWSASPYGRYLDHGGWSDAGALAALCRAVPEGDIVVPAVLHALRVGADDRGDDAADDAIRCSRCSAASSQGGRTPAG